MLESLGIEAFAAEDLSPAGMWMFGTLPEIHKPQVWVSRADAERARIAVLHYEDETAAAQAEAEAAASEANESAEPIEVECDECGQTTLFPGGQHGTIQDCPHCGAYVDVGEFDDTDMPWQEGVSEEE